MVYNNDSSMNRRGGEAGLSGNHLQQFCQILCRQFSRIVRLGSNELVCDPAEGADYSFCIFISQHADSEGAPKACAENGVPNVSYNVDTIHLGPDTALISSRINWAPYFELIIKATAKGENFVTDYIGTMATGSVELTKLNEKVAAKGTQEALDKAISDLKAGKIKVFGTDTFTYKGEKLTEYIADVVDMGDFKPETNVIINGEFVESGEQFRSAPYFDMFIDGITNLDQ